MYNPVTGDLYHPITGEPFRPKDRDLTTRGATGEVIGAMYDQENRLIFCYADGHLFVVDWDLKTGEIVFNTFHPKVIA